MPNMTRCRATPSKLSHIRRHGPDCTLGPPGIPTRARRSARHRSPGCWRRRRRWRGSASPARSCSSVSRPKRCAAQSQCTRRRAIMTEPTPSSRISCISPILRFGTPIAAPIWSAVFAFETVEPEKWIDKSLIPTTHTSHAAARCPGAIDALCLMYTTTKYTKEAMFPHTGTWTLNEFVMVAGDATSDNLRPRFSQIQYSWRSPVLGIQQQIYNVLANNARQAAATTGCRASVRWVTKTRVGLTNHALANLTFDNMKVVGAPKFDDEARKFAREIQTNLGLKPMDNPFLDDAERLMPPQEYETYLRRALPEWQLNYTSDDYVDYTSHPPPLRLPSI